MTTKTTADPFAAIAEHVAHHFALGTISYDLRESEGLAGGPDAEWEPATTAKELIDALERSGKLGRIFDGSYAPGYAVRIDNDGNEIFQNSNDLTELPDQLNAVLVFLAEAVALKNASELAMMRAVALRELYGLNDHA